MKSYVYAICIIFAGLFFSVAPLAQAATVTLVPSTIENGQTTVTLTISGLVGDERIFNFAPDGSGGFEYWYGTYNNGTYTGDFNDVMQTNGSNITNFGNWAFMVVSDGAAAGNDPACDTSSGYETYTDCKNSQYYLSETIINVQQTQQGGNSLFPNGGFFGSSASGAAMVGTVISGVTETTENIEGFYVFVGIFVAFVIAGAVVEIIKDSFARREAEIEIAAETERQAEKNREKGKVRDLTGLESLKLDQAIDQALGKEEAAGEKRLIEKFEKLKELEKQKSV